MGEAVTQVMFILFLVLTGVWWAIKVARQSPEHPIDRVDGEFLAVIGFIAFVWLLSVLAGVKP